MVADHISWEEFWDVFYAQYFSTRVRLKKKMEFVFLRQNEGGMFIMEYQARFLLLERFAPSTFVIEREQPA